MTRPKRRPLTDAERTEIKRLAEEGKLSARGIAGTLNRHHRTIQRVLARTQSAARWDRQKAVAAAAKVLARLKAEEAALRPPGITARPFSDEWWLQNQKNASARAGEILASATRINVPSEDRGVAVGRGGPRPGRMDGAPRARCSEVTDDGR